MKIKHHLLAIFLYTIFTLVLTYPQVKYLSQGVYSTSDQLFYAWIMERNIDSFLHKPLSEFFNANIFYPYQNTLAYGDHMIGETILAAPFILLTNNPIFAQNILTLLSFILSGYGTYLLFNYHFKNRPAAFLAGTAFAFSNVRFNQYDHLNILSTQWLPFIFLFLHKWLEERRMKDLILLFVFYFLTILLTVYYLVMASFAILIYVVLYLLLFKTRQWWETIVTAVLPLGLSLGVAFLITLPTFLPYFKFKKEFPQIKRSLFDNVQFSATLKSYLYSAKTTQIARITGNEKLSEAEAGLFPGFVVIALTGYALFLLRKLNKSEKRIINLFFVSFLIYFLLSFGPFPKISVTEATSLPLPYFIFYYLFPPLAALRVPARFAIFGQLFLSLLAGYGFLLLSQSFLLRRSGKNFRRPASSAGRSSLKFTILTTAFVVLVVLESFSVPLDLVLVETKQDFPAVYHWLAKQPDEVVIIELPIPQVTDPYLFKMTKTRHAFLKNLTQRDYDTIEAYHNYFSTLHKKRIVNGYNAFSPPIYNETVKLLQKFPDEDSLEQLKKLKVDYLILHKIQYSEERQKTIFPEILNNPNLKLIKQFDNDYVFRLN